MRRAVRVNTRAVRCRTACGAKECIPRAELDGGLGDILGPGEVDHHEREGRVVVQAAQGRDRGIALAPAAHGHADVELGRTPLEQPMHELQPDAAVERRVECELTQSAGSREGGGEKEI